MIKDVYLWQNGMVMAFDETGQQVEACQGRATDALPAVGPLMSEETRFHLGVWRPHKTRQVTWAEWEDMARQAAGLPEYAGDD